MKMSLEIDSYPTVIHLHTKGCGTHGTLIVNSLGLSFKPAHHKKDPEITIPWGSIPRFLKFFNEVTA